MHLQELLGALPASIYLTDAAGRIIYCNESAVSLWGARPKLSKDRWCDLARFYHVDGRPMDLSDCPTEAALKQGKCVREREAILERKDGTRISIMPYPTPLRDAVGNVVGVINMTVDLSARKQAERALNERTMQLELAGKAALVGSCAYDVDTERMQISEGYAAIHGLPEGTTEIARCEWLAGVHPIDSDAMEAARRRAFRQRRREYGLEYRIVRPSGEVRWIEARSFVSYRGNGRPERVVGVNIDVTDRKRAEEHQRALNAELDHRVKNVLATVITVAARTKDASSSMDQFVNSLDGRIRSMARTHELLSAAQWQGISVRDLVDRELSPYATMNNAEINGLDAMLKAEAGQAMGMVLHELVTNAAKYGALSTENGRVSIRWERRVNGHPYCDLILEWQEVGGPSVVSPKNFGFGTSVIRDLIPYEFGGAVDLAFARAGLKCYLELPGVWLIDNGEHQQDGTVADLSARTGASVAN
jgi:PAS domain S-box-containing protein